MKETREFKVISPEGELRTFRVKVPSKEEMSLLKKPKNIPNFSDDRQVARQPVPKKQKTVQPVVDDRLSESFAATIAKLSAGQIAIILLIIAFDLTIIFVSWYGIVPWLETLGQFGKAISWIFLILINLGLLLGATWPLVDWKFRAEFQKCCKELKKVKALKNKFLRVDGVSCREATELYDAEIDKRYKQCSSLYFFYIGKGIDYRSNHDFSDKNYFGWFAVALAVGFGAIGYFAAELPLSIAIFLWFTWLPLAIIGWLWEMIIDNIHISTLDFTL